MKPGDFVRLRLAREEIEGTILESYDSSVILIKLKSGYNIGIPKEHVLGHEIIKKYEEKKERKAILRELKGLSSIGLIVTGGTIASKLDPATGGVKALTSMDEFSRFYPGLFKKVNVKRIEIPFLKLSGNMDSDDWIKLASSVKEMLDDGDTKGIIVTHGTDTLHYTSSALSFFLKNLNKPVVLTFAQRSIDRASSDAELNLECSAQFALSDCAEVVIVGHANKDDDFCYALRGTKVRKMHTSRRDTFKAINCEPVAKIFPNKVEFLSQFKARQSYIAPELDNVFNDKVALVKFYPGQDAEILNYYFKEGYKGVIIEVLGLGQVSESWISTIKKLVKQGFVICAASQTIYGSLNPNVYSTGRELEKAGVIYLKDMLSETAFVKLGWVLGHRAWREAGKVKEKMLENVAGEFNELLSE